MPPKLCVFRLEIHQLKRVSRKVRVVSVSSSRCRIHLAYFDGSMGSFLEESLSLLQTESVGWRASGKPADISVILEQVENVVLCELGE